VTLGIVAAGYRRVERTFYLPRKVFRNVGILPQHYTVSQPRKLEISDLAKTPQLTRHLKITDETAKSVAGFYILF
jgi:hypothetical protein